MTHENPNMGQLPALKKNASHHQSYLRLAAALVLPPPRKRNESGQASQPAIGPLATSSSAEKPEQTVPPSNPDLGAHLATEAVKKTPSTTRIVMSEAEQIEAKNRSELTHDRDLARHKRSLEEIVTSRQVKANKRDLGRIRREREVAAFGKEVKPSDEVVEIAEEALRIFPYSDLLRKALQKVATIEKDSDFFFAMRKLAAVFRFSRRELSRENRKKLQTAANQLELFPEFLKKK